MNHNQVLSNIKETARRVLPKRSRLVLFGSQARGDAGAESDWDLLVLLDQDKVCTEDFDRYAFPFIDLGWSLGEYFSPKLYTLSEWDARHAFLQKCHKRRHCTMELTAEERLALAKNRIRRAFSTYREAKIIIEQELWHAAANRLYYACYYITSGLLTYNNHHASTHAGVIRLLGMNYVATGLISKEMGRFYSQLFELRQTGDYDDWKYLTA